MLEDLSFLYWFLAIIPAFYLGTPLLIRLETKLPASPEARPIDLDRIDPKIADYLTEQTEELVHIGFDESTIVRMDTANNVTTYLIMMVNRRTGDEAMATVMIGHGIVTQRLSYLQFSTRLESGEEFVTLNSRILGAFRRKPRTGGTQVPTVTDPDELYRLHRFVMRKHEAKGRAVLYEPGGAVDYLVETVLVKSYEEQVENGWLFYDEAADAYRPTLKGAYLIAWGLLPPMKHIREARMRSRARAILAEFRGDGG
jgi:hypothetical protein